MNEQVKPEGISPEIEALIEKVKKGRHIEQMETALTIAFSSMIYRGTTLEVEQIADTIASALEAHRIVAALDFISECIGLDNYKKLGIEAALGYLQLATASKTSSDRCKLLLETAVLAAKKKEDGQ